MRLQALKSLLLLLLLLGIAWPAAALNFNAFWLYRTSGGEGRDSVSELQQRYNLGLGPQLTWQPTHALRATADISYSQAQRDTGDGMLKTELLSPSARLNLTNDIFIARLAGSARRTRTDSEWGDVSRSWGATLASAWDIPFWPRLNFNHSEQHSDVESSRDLFLTSDRVQSSSTITVDWDLLLADLTYRYSETTDEDRLTGSRDDGYSHFARVETDGRLFADRITYRLSQQYDQNRQDGETFGELRRTGSSLAKVDDATPLDDPLYADPDQDLPLSIEPLERIHVTFDQGTGFPEQIDLLRLDFAGLTAPLAPTDWSLYQRGSDLADWQLVGTVTGTFDPAGDFIEIAVDLAAREILLISEENTAGADLNLLALRAFTVFEEGPAALTMRAAETTSWLTNANLGLRLTRTLNAAFSVIWDQRERETSDRRGDLPADVANRTLGDAERRTLNGTLQWRPLAWLSSSIGVNQTRETETRQNFSLPDPATTDERNSRIYSWSLQTRPLDTMNVTFAVTRNESDSTDRSEERDRTGMQYSLTTTARIYPDLNAAVSFTYAEQEDEGRSERDGRLTTGETESFGVRVDLDARLSRTLSADLDINYNDSESTRLTQEPDNEELTTARTSQDSQNAGATLNLRYRPSAYLSVRGFYDTFFLDSQQADRFGSRVTLALLRTTKTRLTLFYTFTRADETINNFNLNGSWDISRKLSLRTNGSYTLAETNFYSIETTLNLRF